MVRNVRKSESGQVVAFVVGILLVLFGFVALSLDVGFWFLDRRLAQNQADAASLAAVQELPSADMTVAEAVALDYLASATMSSSTPSAASTLRTKTATRSLTRSEFV